jgi:hypothetical protein
MSDSGMLGLLLAGTALGLSIIGLMVMLIIAAGILIDREPSRRPGAKRGPRDVDG